jgi:hypothetical protein
VFVNAQPVHSSVRKCTIRCAAGGIIFEWGSVVDRKCVWWSTPLICFTEKYSLSLTQSDDIEH